MGDKPDSFLRKVVWDYFATHASQRIAIFNFYIVLSSVTATTYVASFKADSNLQPARWMLALSLCFFAFIFWKLDGRNKLLIKNAETALRRFEQEESDDVVLKVFSNEELETEKVRRSSSGWRRLFFWRLHFSYSDCFNSVFGVFFSVGLIGLLQATGLFRVLRRLALSLI
jgi:hypothetical protein